WRGGVTAGTESQRRSRLPTYFNVAAGLALVAVVIPLALSARQQPPPLVAEFAPVAQPQQRTSLESQFGSALGQIPVGLDQPSPTPKPPSPAPIDAAHVFQCVGDPPTQIPDPQSPPCVPYWVGNNGGSTYSHGVTPAAVNVVWNDPEGSQLETDLQTYYNRHFEFYGRHLNFVNLPYSAFSLDPATMEQYAAEADQQLHAFASLNFGVGAYGVDQYYFDELAR